MNKQETAIYKEGWNDGVEWCGGRPCQEDAEIAKRLIEEYIGTDSLGELREDDMILIEGIFNWLDNTIRS